MQAETGYICRDFCAAAERYGRHLAVWAGEVEMNYWDVNRQSGALAAWLRANGVNRGDRVGVCFHRTADSVVAIYAVLRAGAVYVPLDPDWPRDRTEKVVVDCGLKLILAASGGLAGLPGGVGVVFSGSAQWKGVVLEAASLGEEDGNVSGGDLAYIMYTSGSTGQLKGVCMSHAAVRYYARWARAKFTLGPHDRIAGISPLACNISTFDLFAGLCSGAGVFMADVRKRQFPGVLSLFLSRQWISVLYTVPSVLVLLAAGGGLNRRELEMLRLVLFAGEVFSAVQLGRLMQQLPATTKCFNLYGPAETNVCACHHVKAVPCDGEVVPIGRPLDGTELFIVPQGEGGELCVRGPGVMSGYWKEAEVGCGHWLDGGGAEGGRGYRTGDICRQQRDGDWVFIGRKDQMVKD